MIRASDLLRYEEALRAAPDRIGLVRAVADLTPDLLGIDRLLVLRGRPGRWRVEAASHVSVIEPQAPRVRALEAEANAGALVVLPLLDRKERALGAVAIEDGDALDAPRRALLERLQGVWTQAWLAQGARAARAPVPMAARGAIVTGIVAAGFVPVPLVALAPFEIAPADPVVVAAPMDGVIERLAVASDSVVAKGEPLALFDARELEAEAALAERRLGLAHSRLEAAAKRNFRAAPDGEVILARAERDIAKVERERHAARLARARLVAPTAGIVLHSGRDEWAGRPVRTGERIARIADPTRVEARLEVALADVLAIEEGAAARLFPDGSGKAVGATVDRVSYLPRPMADGRLVYSLAARPERLLRIGLRGTARIEGRKVALWTRIFRRPWIAARQRLGL